MQIHTSISETIFETYYRVLNVQRRQILLGPQNMMNSFMPLKVYDQNKSQLYHDLALSCEPCYRFWDAHSKSTLL